MSARLPTARLVIDPSVYRRGLPVLSGDGGLDEVRGVRGLASQIHHGYAYRGGVYQSVFGIGTPILQPASGAWSAVSEVIRIWAPEDMVTLRASAWLEHGQVRLATSQAGSPGTASSAAGATPAVKTCDWTWAATGEWVDVQLEAYGTVAQTCKIYGWTVFDVPMTAAQIP